MLMSTPIQRSTASFAQAYTRAASIFCYELNACFFKGCYELLGGFNSATNWPILRFQARNRWLGYPRGR